MLFSIFINKLNFIWIEVGSIEVHRYDITKSGIDALPNLIIVLCIKSIGKLIKLRLCTRMVSVFLYSDDIPFKAHAYFVDLRFLFHWVENSTVSNVSFDTHTRDEHSISNISSEEYLMESCYVYRLRGTLLVVLSSVSYILCISQH